MRAALAAGLVAASLACAPGTSASSPEPASRDGAITYQLVQETFSLDDCDPSAEGCTYAHFGYPQFSGSGLTDLARDALTSFVQETLHAPMIGEDPGDPAALARELLDEYRQFRQEFPEATSIPWSYERMLDVLWMGDRVVSLELNESFYTGGAHPNSDRLYTVFDLHDGKRLALDDLFRPGFGPRLDEPAEASFRALHGLAPAASLQAEGFWFDGDRFTVNDNWAIDGPELLFYFNPYEVAAYAVGPSQIRLPRAQLQEILRPDVRW